MTSKSEKDRVKQIQDRCQTILLQMLKDEDNKYCVDCDAKGPRWASWNLGIFLCIRCAGIHRNLGVHISKVKSVNLDSWTPEQVVSLQQMGNSRARAVYEANLPDSFRRPQNDSSLEAFIRAKYEQKKYIAKEWVPPQPPKVNWDKEIDEEMERQKKKKKSNLAPLPSALGSDKKYNKSDVIPQLLPKPKSVSPKMGRSTPTTSQAEASKSNGAADLLGLDTTKPEVKPSSNQDDIFSSFFSAPQEKPMLDKPADVRETKADLKIEEQNFFNQAAPTEKERSKLTKDSILALYSQTPNPNLVNQFNPVPQAAPSGQFQQFGNQFQSGGFQAFGGAQLQNGSQGQNQFSAQFNQFPQSGNQFSSPAQQQQQQGFSQLGPQQAFAQNPFPQNGSQPFFGNVQAQPMTQQFNNMSLGQHAFPNAFGAQPNANVASNSTWQ